jgi:hypothetical protein
MRQEIDPKLRPAATASNMNSRCRPIVSEVMTRLRPLKGMRAATGCVSGSRHQAENANTSPHTTITANTARQPKATCAQPPMMGAAAGAKLKIIVVTLMRRCARGPSYRSRTTARPTTTPTPAVMPCNARAAISEA